jgi:hypothetical protein
MGFIRPPHPDSAIHAINDRIKILIKRLIINIANILSPFAETYCRIHSTQSQAEK